MTACSSDRKAQKEYYTEITDICDNITTVYSTFLTNFQTFVSDLSNEDARQAVLDGITDLEDSFNKLGGLDAPAKYKDAQKIFKEAADTALEATEIYKEEITNATDKVTTDQDVHDAFIENIGKGDEAMQTAVSKISEAGKKVDEANK
jgi:hypothetical protein